MRAVIGIGVKNQLAVRQILLQDVRVDGAEGDVAAAAHPQVLFEALNQPNLDVRCADLTAQHRDFR